VADVQALSGVRLIKSITVTVAQIIDAAARLAEYANTKRRR